MSPIIRLGSAEISSYALMFSLGACLGFWLTYKEIERKRMDGAAVLTLTVLAFVGGLIGARGLSWVMNRRIYGELPLSSMFAIWDSGGMSMYGGLMLAGGVGLWYMRRKGLPAWDVADTLVYAWVPFILFVRIGCFLNGCCYGRATTSPFGIVAGGSPNNVNFGIPSHPTQLYAAAAAFMMFVLLRWLRPRRRFEGQLAVAFLGLYATFRFFHELLRGDPRLALGIGNLGALTVNQLASLALVAFAIVATVVLARRERVSPQKAPV